MPIPERQKPFHELDRVERAEQAFATRSSVTALDLISVSITAQVESTLDSYRMSADEMSRKELREEEHQSARLGPVNTNFDIMRG